MNLPPLENSFGSIPFNFNEKKQINSISQVSDARFASKFPEPLNTKIVPPTPSATNSQENYNKQSIQDQSDCQNKYVLNSQIQSSRRKSQSSILNSMNRGKNSLNTLDNTQNQTFLSDQIIESTYFNQSINLPEDVLSFFKNLLKQYFDHSHSFQVDKEWKYLTQQYYRRTIWPDPMLIENLIQIDGKFITLYYRVLYYRQLYIDENTDISVQNSFYNTILTVFDTISVLARQNKRRKDELSPPPVDWMYDVFNTLFDKYLLSCNSNQRQIQLKTIQKAVQKCLDTIHDSINKNTLNDRKSSNKQFIDSMNKLHYCCTTQLGRLLTLNCEFKQAIAVFQTLNNIEKASCSTVSPNWTCLYHQGFSFLMLEQFGSAAQCFVECLENFSPVEIDIELKICSLFAICVILYPQNPRSLSNKNTASKKLYQHCGNLINKIQKLYRSQLDQSESANFDESQKKDAFLSCMIQLFQNGKPTLFSGKIENLLTDNTQNKLNSKPKMNSSGVGYYYPTQDLSLKDSPILKEFLNFIDERWFFAVLRPYISYHQVVSVEKLERKFGQNSQFLVDSSLNSTLQLNTKALFAEKILNYSIKELYKADVAKTVVSIQKPWFNDDIQFEIQGGMCRIINPVPKPFFDISTLEKQIFVLKNILKGDFSQSNLRLFESAPKKQFRKRSQLLT